MTYQGVLDVLQGLWDILFMGRREYTSVFEVLNGTMAVGWGTVLVGNVPQLEVGSQQQGFCGHFAFDQGGRRREFKKYSLSL